MTVEPSLGRTEPGGFAPPGFARLRPRSAAALVAAATLIACGGAPRPEKASEPSAYACGDCNLLLISIDTLRADHLSCYGYPRPTSPAIDAWAARSMLFERAHATSHLTADSHMSIFTSLYPSVHGVRNAKDKRAFRLDEGIETLTEALASAGFVTVGFHEGGNVSAAYGFDRGFERYTRARSVDEAIDWLEKDAPREGRWFAFYHTYHVHDPYLPAPPFDTLYSSGDGLPFVTSQAELDRLLAERYPDGWTFADLREIYWGPVDGDNPVHRQRMIDLYDGEIHEVDRMIGRLLEAVETAPSAAGRTLVVLTSDHGEAFWEHRSFRHHMFLYQPLIHVPLIIGHPAHREGRRIAPRVSSVDIAPTVLDMLGAPPLTHAQGRSLVPLLAGERWQRPIFSERIESPLQDGLFGHGSLIVGERKLIHHRVRGVELYDLARDPEEQRSEIDRKRREGRRLLDRLRAITRANLALRAELVEGGAAVEEILDEETIRQLEALGYLQ